MHHRHGIAIAAGVCLLGILATSGVSAARDAMGEYRRDIHAAVADQRNRADAAACRKLPRLASDPRIDRLEPEERRLLLSSTARALWACGRGEESIAPLQRATREAENVDDVYRLSLFAYDLKRYDLALDSYLDYLARWPQLADENDAAHVWRMHRALHDRPEQQLRLLQAMFDARYDNPVGDNSAMWFELARLYLDRGDADTARAVARRVIEPRHVVRMRIDRRFDAIVDRSTHGADVAQRAEQAIEALRRKRDARPRDIDVVVQLSYALLAAGKHEEAIGLTTRVIDASEPTSGTQDGTKSYANMDKRVWLFNNRAIARYRLGRVDEAIADLERAIVLDPSGIPNVSQTLNLGSLLCNAGRPAEAVARVDAVRQGMSTYGELVKAMVRLCAAVQREDTTRIDRELAFFRRHGDEFPESLLNALTWAGRQDEAEAVFLRMLDDPAYRADALMSAQGFLRAPAQPGGRIYDRERDALFVRPAVVAGVEKYGRIERHPVYNDDAF